MNRGLNLSWGSNSLNSASGNSVNKKRFLKFNLVSTKSLNLSDSMKSTESLFTSEIIVSKVTNFPSKFGKSFYVENLKLDISSWIKGFSSSRIQGFVPLGYKGLVPLGYKV